MTHLPEVTAETPSPQSRWMALSGHVVGEASTLLSTTWEQEDMKELQVLILLQVALLSSSWSLTSIGSSPIDLLWLLHLIHTTDGWHLGLTLLWLVHIENHHSSFLFYVNLYKHVLISQNLEFNVENLVFLQYSIGGEEPFVKGLRASYALLGFKGKQKVDWTKQVSLKRGKGPSTISAQISQFHFWHFYHCLVL